MRGDQVDMQERWTEQLVMEEAPASGMAREARYCPACGQSLDLTRHREVSANRRHLEPFVFLIVGLCFAVSFGLRAWNIYQGLSRPDEEIAALQAAQSSLMKPGNPSMMAADTMSELLIEQSPLRIAFQPAISGLGLGLFMVVVGAVAWLGKRPEGADGRRKRFGPMVLPPSGQLSGVSPWSLGSLLTVTLIRMILMLFIIIVGVQVIRGVPPSVQLLDQALTRLVALVGAIASAL